MKGRQRTFEVVISPSSTEDFAADLVIAGNGKPEMTIRLDGVHLKRLRPALLGAIVSSKHARSALSPARRTPILLTEDAGVRLALTSLATKPLSKPSRIEDVKEGIEAMTSEEALYWYAQCTGPFSQRSLRALRALLVRD
jgi:hypothetical protein